MKPIYGRLKFEKCSFHKIESLCRNNIVFHWYSYSQKKLGLDKSLTFNLHWLATNYHPKLKFMCEYNKEKSKEAMKGRYCYFVWLVWPLPVNLS